MPISPDRILYEDEHLLAVNKLHEELVVKGKGKVGKLPLLDFLQKDYPGLRAVHRIDFETSGVVLFAKTKRTAATLMDKKSDQDSPQNKENKGRWIKTYRTLVMGRIQQRSGAIRKPLPARSGGVIPAETLYKILELFPNSSYVEATIETGRHHQIRRHFAGIGHPLVCDRVYGHKKFNGIFIQEFKYRDFFLHASSMELTHPITGEHLKIDAPLPGFFEAVLKKLRKC